MDVSERDTVVSLEWQPRSSVSTCCEPPVWLFSIMPWISSVAGWVRLAGVRASATTTAKPRPNSARPSPVFSLRSV